MNGRIPALIGVGAASSVGGLALHRAIDSESQQGAADARAEWEGWRDQLDAEFPNVAPSGERSDRRLGSPEAEQRFEQFLDEHPAPPWIRTEHTDLRRISIEAFEPTDPDPSPARWAYGGIGAAAIAGTVVGGLSQDGEIVHRLPPRTRMAGLVAIAVGAPITAAFIGGAFLRDDHRKPLMQNIESQEWHTPHSILDGPGRG